MYTYVCVFSRPKHLALACLAVNILYCSTEQILLLLFNVQMYMYIQGTSMYVYVRVSVQYVIIMHFLY